MADIQSCNTSLDSSLFMSSLNMTGTLEQDQDQCYVYEDDCLQNDTMNRYVNRSDLSSVPCQSWNFSRTIYESTLVSEVMYRYII